MNPFPRLFLWLARGDNAFNIMLFVCVPPLVTIIFLGWQP